MGMEIGAYVGDLLTGPATLEETVAAARSAADAGLATVWTAQALGWDSLTLLALVGTRVQDVKLGSAVVPVPQRHPLVLAGQALSVQAAVGGRLTLGIGAGIGTMVEGMFGLPRDRPARRMREYLTALGPLLRGEVVDFQGESLHAAGQVHVPGAPAPQVLLAALGPAMLTVAGECADGTVTWMTGPRTLAEHIVPTVTRAAQVAGRGVPRVVAGVLVCVTDDADAARTAVAGRYALAAQVPEYRAVLDREGATGAHDVAVIGDEETVAGALKQYAEAGVTELAAAVIGTSQDRARTLDLLARLRSDDAGARPAPLSTQDRVAIHELINLHGHQPIGHHVTNILISQRPDGTVAVRSKGLAVMPDGSAGSCVYDDQVVRTAEGWRLAHRRISPARRD